MDLKQLGSDLIDLVQSEAAGLGHSIVDENVNDLKKYTQERLQTLAPLLAQDSSQFTEVMKTEADSALCKMAGFAVDSADKFDARLRSFGQAAWSMAAKVAIAGLAAI